MTEHWRTTAHCNECNTLKQINGMFDKPIEIIGAAKSFYVVVRFDCGHRAHIAASDGNMRAIAEVSA